MSYPSLRDEAAGHELRLNPPLWTGTTATHYDQYWGQAARELHAAPTLADGQQPQAVAQEHRRLASRVARSLGPWTNAGSLELRYIWGGPPGQAHLRLVFVGRAIGASPASADAWAEQLVETVVALFPDGYQFGPLTTALPLAAPAWAELERVEEVRQPGAFVPPGAASYYYFVHPLGGDGSAWPSLAPALARETSAGFLSIVLMPTAMADLERQAIDHICSVATYLSAPQMDHDFFGNPTTNPPDAAAGDLLRTWQQFPERYGLLGRVGVAASAADLARLTSLVGSIITDGAERPAGVAGSQFKVVTDITDREARDSVELGVVCHRYAHPVWQEAAAEAPYSLARMPYYFSEEEAGGLLVLPVPDANGVPGIARHRRQATRRASSTPDTTTADVPLGQVLHHGTPGAPIGLPLSALNRHCLIVGASGSGKTTTVLSLLAELWRRHQVPFLVIEPTKTEYRSLLHTPGLDDLQVIVLGRDDLAPLRLNPLAPLPGVRREVHANGVLASLKLALPLPPPLPQLLDEALDITYRQAGWKDSTTSEEGVPPPSLRDLLDTFEARFDEQGYIGEARNVGVAMAVRLRSLLRGARGRLLDTVESTDLAALLQQPVVIELDEVGDHDDQLLLSAFLLERLRAVAKARGASGGQLRHVTVLEEAHRLLGGRGRTDPDAGSGDQLRTEAVRVFSEAIAELRARGEGFILASQSPADLAEAAIANTAVRIAHRLERAVDRRALLDDFDASDHDREIAARLRVGEALVRTPDHDEAELVAVTEADGVDSARTVSDDEVRARVDGSDDARRCLPYSLCTRTICVSGCDPVVRRRGRDIADDPDVATVASELWAEAQGRASADKPLLGLLARETSDDHQQTYCAAVHLSLTRRAFTPVCPTLRQRLVEAAQSR